MKERGGKDFGPRPDDEDEEKKCSKQDGQQGLGLPSSEFFKKVAAMREWMSQFDDRQRTLAVNILMPYFGSSQLHHLSNQLPEGNLHALCQPGCGDLMRRLPPQVVRKIIGYLDPQTLISALQVSKFWHDMFSSQWIWKRLCYLPRWRLSPKDNLLQMSQHQHHTDTDWKSVFRERFKLRKSWMAGKCHVRTFEGHSEGISCVQFDGSRIVSGSHDKTIRVWNIKTNSKWSVLTLTGHSGEVRCLHLEPGGNRLVSGSTDTTIKVWDLDIQPEWSSIGCRVTMVGHTDTVRCVHMSSRAGIVISGSYDRSLMIWCLKTGRCEAILRGHEGHVVCLYVPERDGGQHQRATTNPQSTRRSNFGSSSSESEDSDHERCTVDSGSDVTGDIILSGSSDMTIKVWCIRTHQNLKTLRGHRDAVTCLSLTEAANVTSSRQRPRIISGSLDRTIKLWDLATGDCLSTLDWMSSEGHTGVVRCLQTDAWRIVSAADDKTIKVWSLDSGQRLVTLRSHTDGVTCLQFNDFFIVSGSYDKTVKLWDFTVC